MYQRLRYYSQLIRFEKPIGTLLLLWPTLWAVWIAADGHPSLKIISIFCLGVFCMRSAGCAMNDFADRHLDGAVARTRQRPLACGAIKPWEAIMVFAFFGLCALILVLQLNLLTLYFSFIGLAITMLYPFCKRFTYLPQFILGCAFSFGILMAFTAQTNHLPAISLLLYSTAILWPIAYDTMYAMADKEDDLKIGIKSTAIFFGNADKLIIGLLQIVFIGLLVIVGWCLNLAWYYYLALVCSSLLMIYQQYLLKDRDPALCFRAFLNNNWVGLIIFLGIVASYYF